jgi:hypothetical protein
VFPYLLVALMAYGGASVVYSLGTEVTRAYGAAPWTDERAREWCDRHQPAAAS